jgi:hypothetical protein
MRLAPKALLIFCVVALSAAGCRDSNEYHQEMMKKAYGAMLVNPTQEGGLVAQDVDESQARRYEKHRDILVARGVLFRKVYVFDNVRATSRRASVVLKKLLQSPPYAVVDFKSPHTSEKYSLEITLWGRQEDKDGWDRFIEDHDTPVQPTHGANLPIPSDTNRTPSAAGSDGLPK